MWSALSLSFTTPLFSLFDYGNIYLRLFLEICLNILIIVTLILIQKKLIKSGQPLMKKEIKIRLIEI